MANKKVRVSFTATKKVSKPVVIKFDTKRGPISFTATKKVSKPVVIKFYAKKKK